MSLATVLDLGVFVYSFWMEKELGSGGNWLGLAGQEWVLVNGFSMEETELAL